LGYNLRGIPNQTT